jgi:hypothetical protein
VTLKCFKARVSKLLDAFRKEEMEALRKSGMWVELLSDGARCVDWNLFHARH